MGHALRVNESIDPIDCDAGDAETITFDHEPLEAVDLDRIGDQ